MKPPKILAAAETQNTAPSGFVRVGACQMDIQLGNVERNRDACLVAMETAAREGVQLLVFPECALTGYAFADAAAAERGAVKSDDALAPMVQACRKLDLAVVVGLLEFRQGLLLNSALAVTAEGVGARYRKTHLPHLGADRWVCAGGEPLAPTELAGVQTGVLICYDGSFPEASRALALRGAELIALPTNWPAQAIHKAQWLPNTRAYENVVYFMTVNRVGEESGFTFPGQSRICSPKGLTLVEAPAEGDVILVADIDPAQARTKKIVRGDDYWVDRIGDRRPDLYIQESPAS